MLVSEYIPKLIRLNRTEQALSTLSVLVKDLDPSFERQILLHQASFSQLKTDKEKGNLSQGEEKLHFNKINNAILDLLEELPAELSITIPPRERQKLQLQVWLNRSFWWIFAGLWLGLVLLLFALQQQHKTNIKARLELQLNSITFTIQEKGSIEIDNAYSSLSFQQFDQVKIPAQSLLLTRDFDSPMDTIPLIATEGQVEVLPVKEKTSSVFLEEVLLDELVFPDTSRINVTIPEASNDELNIIQIALSHGNLVGNITFQDSLSFELGSASLANLDHELNKTALDWAGVKVVVPSNEAFPLTFASSNPNFALLLEPYTDTDQKISTQQLSIGRLSFIRPEHADPPKSGINSGTIYLLNKQDRAYDHFELEPNSYLHLADYQSLQMSSFDMSGSNIQITLEGTIGEIWTGSTYPPQTQQNPNCLKWLIYNKIMWLMLSLVLAILLSVGLWVISRKLRV